MLDISIIIVNYNVKEFLQNLLESIKKASNSFDIEIIVVDNASNDGSVKLLENKYPEVFLIANKTNVGFAKAVNLALKQIRGKFILIINPDTIIREDTLAKMLEFFKKNPDADLAGCKVLNPDGTLQLACRRSFPGPWTSFTKVTGLSTIFPKSKIFAKYNLTYLDENKTYEVDAVSGSFMMFRREVYEKIGGFDPQFFMYGEDLDFCYRAQQAGYKIYYVHDTEIIHYKGESTKRSSIDETKVFYDAMHLFVKKHLSSSLLIGMLLRIAIIIRKFLAFLNMYKTIILSIFIDFILFVFSVFIAESIYNKTGWRGFPQEVKPWIYIVPAAIQVIISVFVGSYKKHSISILKNFLSLIIGFIFLSSITYFFKQYGYSRAVLLITYGIVFFAFTTWRILIKLFFNFGISNYTYRGRTIIVGTNDKARELALKLKYNFTKFYHVYGYIGNKVEDIGKKISGLEVIGIIDNIHKVIAEYNINKVIFSSEQILFNEIFEAISKCEGLDVDFLFAGNKLDYLVGKSDVTMLDNIPLLKIQYNILSINHRISKMVMDFLISLPLLFFLYPFVFLYVKMTKAGNDFINFMIQIPVVISGKKSLVGPKDNSYYKNLYIGKCGLTGLWYTELYNRQDVEEINKMNLFYAKNQNIWLDLEILGKTFVKMFIKSE